MVATATEVIDPAAGQPLEDSDDIRQIREAVRALCADYPGEYWREKDRERQYPTEFVRALTEAGFLAVLIPEEYGGSGLGTGAAAAILEEIHASGGNGAACHAQMYIMGTILRHGSAEQKREWLPGIARGDLRLQAFGVTEPTSGTNTLGLKTVAVRDGDHYVVNGQKVWTSRAEHSDLMLLLARTTPADQVEKRTDGLSVFVVDMREALGNGLTIRPIRTMINHSTTEVFFDDMRVPAGNLIGDRRQGVPLHPRRDERRAHRGGGGVHRGCPLVRRARERIREGAGGVRPPHRAEPGRPVPDRAGLRRDAGGGAHGAPGGGPLRQRASLRGGGEHGTRPTPAKHLAAEAAWHAADTCIQTFGGFGMAEEYDVERKFRETRLYQIAPISTNLILSYLGEHVLGMPRSY